MVRILGFRGGLLASPEPANKLHIKSNHAPWLGATPLVVLSLGEAGRVLVRPSGTEPKLKIYVDLKTPAGKASDVWTDEEALRATASRVASEMVRLRGF